MPKAKQKACQLKTKTKIPAGQVLASQQGSFFIGEIYTSPEEELNSSGFHNIAITRLIERIKSL